MFKRLLSIAMAVLTMTTMARAALVTASNEPATVTFVLDKGTEDQKATYSSEDYFVTSRISWGSNIVFDGLDNKQLGQTRFGVVAKQTKAQDDNQIHFIFQPKPGLKFTPTKVSLRSTRFGTGGGHIDVSWENPDGTYVQLIKDKNPNRDNDPTNYSDYSADISGAKVAEGPCGIMINLYSLDPGKTVGFQNIVIEGTIDGTEVEMPVLASFTANGVDYLADDVFNATASGYEGTIELGSAETMVSASNPLTNVVAAKGEVGQITYSGNNDNMVVTIPLSLGATVTNYVLNVVRKPLYTLTYYNTDAGTVMGTQKVEKDTRITSFAVDYNTAVADDGYKVRGWFAEIGGGYKYNEDFIVTGDINLYALQTRIETVSTYRRYNYNLTDENFYAEDHEAFNPTGGYWHDSTHGWAFKDGDKIDILVGPKASVSMGICYYGYGTTIDVTDAAGNEIASLQAKAEEKDNDGQVVAFDYEGEGGTLTLTLHGTGELYLHNFKIMNTMETNYTQQGQWYYVKPGNAESLVDAIETISALNSKSTAERAYIFVPDGVYDLKYTCLTEISGYNISLIGQSMEGTIIKNAPHYNNEGISKTATLKNSGTNIYLQDLTIQNALDYYGAIDAKLGGGRAVAWWDKGVYTICKNVTLLSYQDTYYTNNVNGKYYWETSDIHGTVDFFCGEGTMFYNKSIVTVEKRNRTGKGECTLTAPSTKAGDRHGYVFYDCNIVNYAEKYNFGRAWSNEPRCAFINTTVNDSKLNTSRWTAGGMNVCAKEFVEYNTMDANGKVVSPSSKVITFTKGTASNKMETILTAEQAAEFTVDKVFPTWDPVSLAAQVAAPAPKFVTATSIEWPAVDGASAYAVFRNGQFVGTTTATSYNVENNQDTYTVRAANSMGGLGAAGTATTGAGINDVEASAEVVKTVYYNAQGAMVDGSYRGVVVKVSTLSDGTVTTAKVVNR